MPLASDDEWEDAALMALYAVVASPLRRATKESVFETESKSAARRSLLAELFIDAHDTDDFERESFSWRA